MAVAVVDVQVNSQAAVRNLQQVNSASKAATAGIGALRGAIGGLVGAFSAAAALRFVVVKTAELETQTRSIETLTGSVQQAKQIIQELQQLGAVTPFTSTELIDAAKRLQAFGVEAKNVVDTTRRLADVAGATGAELQGLVTAYGQVQAKGRLQGEELLQFQERGIALQEELRKMYGMTGEEFQKALSKGRISAEAVEVAIVRLTEKGGKYANGAIAQSTTLAGKFSTLTDNVENLAKTIGAKLNPILKSTLDLAIKAVDSINQAMAAGSIGIGQKQEFQRRAESIVGAQAGFMPGGPFGAGQISVQYGGKTYKGNASEVTSAITNDLINAAVQQQLGKTRAAQAGGPRPAAVTTPPPLLQGTDSGRGAGGARLDMQDVIGGEILAGLQMRQAQAATQKQLQLNFATQEKLGEVEKARINYLYEYYDQQLEIKAIQQTIAKREEYRNTLVENQLRKNATAAERQIALTNVLMEEDKLRAQINVRQEGLNRLTAAHQGELIAIQQSQAKELEAGDAKVQQLQDEQDLLRARLNGNEAEVILKQQLRDITKDMTPEQTAQAKALIDGNEALKKQLTVAEQMKSIYADIGMSIKDSVVGAIQGAIDGTKSLQEVASNLLSSIANKMLDIAVNMALFGVMEGTGTGGGLLGGLFRAKGGSVTAGQPYIVGEKGPELFMPGRSGGIAPAGSFGGGTNVVVNVDASGSSVQGNEAQGQALGRAMAAAVQQELIKQKRPGGLLA